MTDTTANVDVNVDQKRKEAYFTASQGQLIWARFKKQRAAMVGALVLVILISAGFFSPFLSPYAPTIAGRDEGYVNGAPQIPKFWDENGFSLRPFIYSYERTRSIKTNFRWVTTVDKDKRRYVVLFPQGDRYKFLGMTFTTHLFGVDKGKIHLFGTDGTGKDIWLLSRICGLLAVRVERQGHDTRRCPWLDRSETRRTFSGSVSPWC